MGQNYVEKIAQRYAVDLDAGHTVRSGDYLSMRPQHVMTHDNTAAVIPKFRKMGAKRVRDPRQPVFALDHDIQNRSAENLEKYRTIEEFAREQGVAFFPAGRGIGHQVMVEEGFVLPATFVVGSDSHSNLYGAVGALGTPVVRTDAAAIWATGRTWWQLPDVVRVHLAGELQPGVSGKDVIITLIGIFNQDQVLNCCIEFTGPGVASLSMDERLTISNMTTEWGALAGVFPYDETARSTLQARAEVMRARGDSEPRLSAEILKRAEAAVPVADPDAEYAMELEFDLSAVTPFVAGPNEVKTIVALPEIESQRVAIDKAFLLSCVNGRAEDFAEAAQVMRGKRVAEGVAMYIAAASSAVEEESRQRGDWDALLAAGATALPPGCGPCIGLGAGILADGEVGISATNRNFKGRMGSRDSQVYLSSPAVVAASAVAGHIAAPESARRDDPGELRRALERGSRAQGRAGSPAAATRTAIVPGFPEAVEGELLLVAKDNMNTDGIYGKDWTYQEGLTPEEMGSKAMLNYDPRFQEIAERGDLLVGGFNFGTGSSREQAATALKFRGIQLVIAGSFSQTYKRNAFNNGYVLIECPDLVEELRRANANDPALTIRTGRQARVDFVNARIECAGGAFPFAPLGKVAQELVAQGGFEEVIRAQIARMDG
jgi:homoaconitate hydratase